MTQHNRDKRYGTKAFKPRPPTAWLAVGSVIIAASLAACQEATPTTKEAQASAPQNEKRLIVEATAYSVDGKTASGTDTRDGIVAADPEVIPLGSRIRVSGAGEYSGLYHVADTGRTIKGREIDIFVPNEREAKRFGRRRVQVEILE